MAAAAAPSKSISARLADGLKNVITGVGTSRDRTMHSRYGFAMRPLTKVEIDAAYRTSGLVRKVHDLPPYDETRAWRNWQAEDDQITAIEAEEKRLNLRHKVRLARTWSRLYGGAAMILGVPGADTMEPYDPVTLSKGGLRYIHLVTRWQIGLGPIDYDLGSDFFGQPTWFQLSTAKGQVQIHPSRVVPFISQALPPDVVSMMSQDGFWGDPLLMTLERELKRADMAPDEIAAMLTEAKLDTISIPNLTTLLAQAGYEQRLQARLGAAEMAKSILNTRILDADEKWETRQLSFADLPDLIDKFWQLVAAVADIPVTRLLGTSAKGLNATGEGDNDNYDEMVRSRQQNDLRPLLDRIDDSVIVSALGSRPDGIRSEFADLEQADPSEEADLQAKRAATAKIYVDSGLVPRQAMATAVQNALVEDAVYPGLEAALDLLQGKRGEDQPMVGLSVDELKAIAPVWQAGGLPKLVIFQLLSDAGMLPAEIDSFEAYQNAIEEEGEALGTMTDPNEGSEPGEPVDPNAPAVPATKPGPGRQQQQTAQDAEPRTLYVSRPVVNAADLIAWARGQGFKTTQPADALHVTIAFSRTPVDWMKVGDAPWGQDASGQITIPPGGARLVEAMGMKGAVALLFNSSELAYRWCQIKDAGASWDWPEYQPRITITWDGQGIDLSKVEPYRGKIVLGPERFEPVQDAWKQNIEEV